MPVIVIGADTEYGRAVATVLAEGGGEVRAFVTDPGSAHGLRDLGIKVAVGDVSDASHIEGAARRAYSAVIIAEAGRDTRERSFAATFETLVNAWATGLRDAGVQRIIWIGAETHPPDPIIATAREAVAIRSSDLLPAEVAEETARLDGLASLD